MLKLRSGDWFWVVTLVVLTAAFSGCGGHKPPGVSPYPARVNLIPTGSLSLQQGNILTFTALAQNSTNTTISATFTYASSDNSILNVTPNGVACAGVWNASYTVCTPAGSGPVYVTASALGTTSVPTLIFVHPPIDNITVTGVLLDNVPIQEPCLSQGQAMTVEAHAFSQGSDITSSVGTFTWSANNPTVVNIKPIIDLSYNFPTNQATATAALPGLTEIYATASGVTSNSFLQPTFQNKQGATSPPLDFFETCLIQNIQLELTAPGSQQTTFSASKGTGENIFATLTDVVGNSTLPNTYGGVQLSRIPLVWTASQPGSVAIPAACQESCGATTPSPGAGSVTAACSPPICNIGYPLSPPVLSTAACTQFFKTQFPQITSCQQFIPEPVYPATAISGVVEGPSTIPTALATSLGCSSEPSYNCITSLYSVALSKGQVGIPITTPANSNSLLFDPAGDRAYLGGDFGAEILDPTKLGTTNPAFTPITTVTGKVLATSPNGQLAIFSDTTHVPNVVYVTNASNASSISATPLNISGASAAAFSPDGLKAFIFGFDNSGNPTLYVYSPLQALQPIALPPQTTVSSILFSTNGAFAYVVEPSLSGGGPAFSVYDTCDNRLSTDPVGTPQIFSLTASPLTVKALPDGVHLVAMETGGSIDYITSTVTGIPAATLNSPASSYLCPMKVSHSLANLNLRQGSIQVINFFPSPDGSLLYILARDRSSVLVYDLISNTVSAIQLAGNATPLSGDISIDDGTILIAGSDGLLHEVGTSVGGSDQLQLSFPDLPNYLNPFCTFTPASGACSFDLLAVRP
ncbi:MAG TPA: hypothetical protein VMG31_12095 [Verrucomicrobiae bacterium]|nr:hypothetical protein [Verrucomicrobiae bacterium]